MNRFISLALIGLFVVLVGPAVAQSTDSGLWTLSAEHMLFDRVQLDLDEPDQSSLILSKCSQQVTELVVGFDGSGVRSGILLASDGLAESAPMCVLRKKAKRKERKEYHECIVELSPTCEEGHSETCVGDNGNTVTACDIGNLCN